MKKFIIPVICSALIIVVTIYADTISSFIKSKLSDNHPVIINDRNIYAKTSGFMFVDLSEDYVPYSYQDLLNIIYSTINNGWETFTFYCPSEYASCIEDMEKIGNDSLILTHINNFVHPYNSSSNLGTTIYESGEITLNVYRIYTEEEIAKIDAEIDRIISEVVDEKKSDYANLKALHDYVINNTKYDEAMSKDGESEYASDTAYGVLFDHYAICNGYTDVMAIMLTKLGYENYKIATTPDRISYESKGHVWNAVLYDDSWVHIDLTWDDPVSESGADYLYHKYFLVNNEALKEADDGKVSLEEHNFDNKVYLEFNESINEIISS